MHGPATAGPSDLDGGPGVARNWRNTFTWRWQPGTVLAGEVRGSGGSTNTDEEERSAKAPETLGV